MMAGLKAIGKITETVQQILDTTDKEELINKYHNGGIKVKMDIEGAEVFILVKDRTPAPEVTEAAEEAPQ